MKEVNEDALEPNIAGSENNLNSDGGGSSDNSGYHSDSDSTVMMSGNSPFISKEARYSFLSRSGEWNFFVFLYIHQQRTQTLKKEGEKEDVVALNANQCPNGRRKGIE